MADLPPLATGFHPVPPGYVALVVTHMEMRQRPTSLPRLDREDLRLVHVARPDVDAYIDLFTEIGNPWLWFSRMMTNRDRLEAMITAPGIEIYKLILEDKPVGLLELDFSKPTQAYLAFFGLTPEAIGIGAGRFLMNHALRLAWRDGINCFGLNTCNADHPSAIGFYQKTGFVATKRMVEIAPDPRLTGTLPRNAAPHIPVIE